MAPKTMLCGCRKIVIGYCWLYAVLLASPVDSLGQQAGPSVQVPHDEGTIVLINATSMSIRHQIWYQTSPKLLVDHTLSPRTRMVWKTKGVVICRFQEREWLLKPNNSYRFQGKGQPDSISLVTLPDGTPKPTSTRLTTDTLPELSVAQLRPQLKEGEALLAAIRAKDHKIQTLQNQVSHLTTQAENLQQTSDALDEMTREADRLRKALQQMAIRRETTKGCEVALLDAMTLTGLSRDPTVVTVLTWPPGAAVYLSKRSPGHPCILEYLGPTPLACDLPASRYDLTLALPNQGVGQSGANAKHLP